MLNKFGNLSNAVSKSPVGKLDIANLKKLGYTSLIVGVSAGLTYFGQNLAGVDLGAMSALLVPIISTFIDTIIQSLNDNKKEKVG